MPSGISLPWRALTDKIGSADYNEALSRRRADRVVAYLVTKHDIPVYRIQLVGLGKEKPVDEGRNREARAKNRVVGLFEMDPLPKIGGSRSNSTPPRRTRLSPNWRTDSC